MTAPVAQSLSNESWLTITLSALTIALAVLAVVVAVASVWGFSNIKSDAKRSAEEAAQKKLSEYLDSEQIQAKLKEEVAGRVGIEADRERVSWVLTSRYERTGDH
jgi:flagellar basal body-associated protein FliL